MVRTERPSHRPMVPPTSDISWANCTQIRIRIKFRIRIKISYLSGPELHAGKSEGEEQMIRRTIHGGNHPRDDGSGGE
jgi:hypothetical protein